VTRPAPLTPTEAYEAIQRLLALRDSIGWTAHARRRARERQFTADDVRRVLVNGTVSAHPIWNEEYRNWIYKITGRDYDGDPLALVIALEPRLGRITLITGEDA
jgi:hypothetical protein